MYFLSKKSISNLQEAHPDLQRVMLKAIGYSEIDFSIQYPVRTPEEQQRMLDTGASKTSNSRHLLREQDVQVHAVDVVAGINGDISWDIDHYRRIAKAVFRAAIEENVQVEWGGLWTNPVDGPHFQLSWKEYP
mgnify:CR=1 FL=1